MRLACLPENAFGPDLFANAPCPRNVRSMVIFRSGNFLEKVAAGASTASGGLLDGYNGRSCVALAIIVRKC